MPDLHWEETLRREGYPIVAGLDEAGRGPLAGPVVAAAVILPEDFQHAILNDSKQLSARKREALFGELTQSPAILTAWARVDVEVIDRINILQANHEAMRQAVAALPREPDAVLIDGRPVPEFPWHQQALVKGDSLSLSIAAASIIAKVQRDRLMIEYGALYPQYGFEKHKGYGTREHLQQLKRHGPCPIHRQTFGPVARLSLPFEPEER